MLISVDVCCLGLNPPRRDLLILVGFVASGRRSIAAKSIRAAEIRLQVKGPRLNDAPSREGRAGKAYFSLDKTPETVIHILGMKRFTH